MIYTEGRLQHDEDTKDLAPRVSVLVDECNPLFLGLWSCWREETLAQSGVDAVNYRLDRHVERHARTVRFLSGEDARGEALYERYYKKLTPSRVVALSLEPELKVVGDWLVALPKEEAPELLAFVPVFQQSTAEGTAALRAREEAAAKRRDYCSRALARKVEECNQQRLDIYGELVKRGAANYRESGWADSFFKKQTRSSRGESAPTGWRGALYALLEALGIEASDTILSRIEEERDTERLKVWHRALSNGETPETVFPTSPAPL
jgi:hypothetical protein